jgi:formylglycine-generating enzyme required for sulfatase activity
VLLSQARIPRPAPAPQPAANASAVAFELEAEGFGCVLETSGPPDARLKAFLDKMKSMTASPLLSISAEWRYLNQTLVPIAPTKTYENAPAGTVKIPKTDAFRFQSRGVMIEGDDQHGVGEQYPWEPHPAREHNHTMPISSMYMHKYPVTTANYSTYLQATEYQPDETYNWLKNWKGQQTPPQDLLDKPVTYISLTEARLYCAWAGGRLPHSYEWQYAAQGTDSRAYPWGSTKDQSKYPTLTTGNTFNGPESVTAHAPAGDSPFGVSDLVGNVWQYTSEFQDAHTRAVVTQGGSNYRPSGSNWYYPQAVELYTHNKYFLMSDTYERAGTVGFRCVFDAE